MFEDLTNPGLKSTLVSNKHTRELILELPNQFLNRIEIGRLRWEIDELDAELVYELFHSVSDVRRVLVQYQNDTPSRVLLRNDRINEQSSSVRDLYLRSTSL